MAIIIRQYRHGFVSIPEVKRLSFILIRLVVLNVVIGVRWLEQKSTHRRLQYHRIVGERGFVTSI